MLRFGNRCVCVCCATTWYKNNFFCRVSACTYEKCLGDISRRDNIVVSGRNHATDVFGRRPAGVIIVRSSHEHFGLSTACCCVHTWWKCAPPPATAVSMTHGFRPFRHTECAKGLNGSCIYYCFPRSTFYRSSVRFLHDGRTTLLCSTLSAVFTIFFP